MDNSVAEQFVILSLNPEKGRVSLDSIHFRYSLTGALLMDYLDQEEFKLENKRVVWSFRMTGDTIHDMFAERIMNSSGNWKISFWIRRLTRKSRLIFSEIIKSLEKRKLISIEHKKFIGIFPYKRYWFLDNGIRNGIIERLREILLYGKQPVKKELMLLGIVEAARAYRLLSREKGEARILRKKNNEILKGDVMSAEISKAVREVQAAIVTSVITATIAAQGSH
jgi:hypothetical protein